MDSTELRIGNWVQFSYGFGQIEIEDLYINRYNPIPITEEWLIKFGLDYNINGYWSKLNEYYWTPTFWDDLKLGKQLIYESTTIQYIHQLQNLHFALTGEELTYST